MALVKTKAYKYQLGDVIETNDGRIGLIASKSNAYEYMALEQNVARELISKYANILIYKVIIDI